MNIYDVIVFVFVVFVVLLFFYRVLTEIQRRLGILISLKKKQLGEEECPHEKFLD